MAIISMKIHLSIVHTTAKTRIVPVGLTNPVTTAPGKGYNSDPTLTYDRQAKQLVCYYRPVISGSSKLVKKTTRDGKTWSEEIECPIVGASAASLSPQVFKVKTNKFIAIGQY